MQQNYLSQFRPNLASEIKKTLLCGFSFLLLGSTAISQNASKVTVTSPWEKQGLTEEILNKRSRTAKHFAKTGNTSAAFISPNSIHYLENDNWLEISTEIKSNNGNNTHPFKSEENAVKTYFPANPFQDALLLKTKEGNFSEKIKAIRFLDASHNVIGSLPISNNLNVSVEENKISYTGFFPDVTLVYALANDSRKFDLQINASSFFNSIPSAAKYILIEEEFTTANGTKIQSSGDVIQISHHGEPVFEFSKPVAFDNNTVKENMTGGTISFTEENKNTSTLRTVFSLAWMKSSERVFPLHLDPTVNYYPQNVSMWTGNQSSSAGKTSGMLRLTTAASSSWAKFDLATLPSGASVTQATYYGYHYTTTGAAKMSEIRGLQTVDPVPATAGALFAQIYSGPIYNGNYTFGAGTFQWQPGVLNSTALTDIAAAAGNWIGLGFTYLSGLTTFMYQYGINGTSSQMCYIEVIYFTVPCSGTPTSNTIVPVSFTTCPGLLNPPITLANTYSVMGISYQWQSSTVSPVGPFTSVPGATLASSPVPTLGVNTWYQAVITCTNSAGTITLAPMSMFVAGTTTNSVPYYEDFENIQFENRLPNCSWSSTNVGTIVETHKASKSDNRVARSGTNYATFSLPATNQHVYSNGIQMYAGVTYSASVYYATEYFGYNNWTDLSILVGPNQTPSGLTVIASVSPAISGPHKLLGNTFTVPSSGLYYIAIRANGTSGSALYLTWDDLSVTIPCGAGSPNTPTVSLSASANTICAGQSVNLTANGADTFSFSSGATGGSTTEFPQSTITYSVFGTNTLTGCTDIQTQHIVVNPAPAIFVVASPPAICAGDQTNLTAFNGTSYNWSNGSTGNNIVVSPTVTTVYSVIGANAFGCTTSFPMQITVKPLPVLTAQSSHPFEACKDDVISMTVAGALTYQWMSGVNSTIYHGNVITLQSPASGSYTVYGTNAAGCVGKAVLFQNISECTGIGNISSSEQFISLYPNPSTGEFTVEFASEKERTVEVIDVTGRLIIAAKTSDSSIDVNIKDVSAGIYYVKILSANEVQVMKIVKQ